MSRDLADSTSRITYDRFLEFERLMRVYPRTGGQPFNPTPLGFCSFALTLFVFSMHTAGATVYATTYPTAGVAMGLALFYGGLIELIAGLLEFRVGNNFYALTFCSYAGFWFGLGALYCTGSFNFLGVYSGDTSIQEKALGIFYLGWTIFTLAMLISALRTNLHLVLFFFFLMVTYILLTASKFLMGDPNTQRAAGAIGIFTAVIAWAAGFSSLLKRGDNSYFNIPNYSLTPKAQADLNAKGPVEVRA